MTCTSRKILPEVAKELDGGRRSKGRAQTESIGDANYYIIVRQRCRYRIGKHLDSIVFHKLATYNIFIGEVVNPTC